MMPAEMSSSFSPKKMLWFGYILSALPTLLLLFSGAMNL